MSCEEEASVSVFGRSHSGAGESQPAAARGAVEIPRLVSGFGSGSHSGGTAGNAHTTSGSTERLKDVAMYVLPFTSLSLLRIHSVCVYSNVRCHKQPT